MKIRDIAEITVALAALAAVSWVFRAEIAAFSAYIWQFFR
jgi:hypothetical protein